MQILNFNIQHFKSLNDVTVRGLSDINMIYGYNNSGKSNILKALELIFKIKKPSGGAVKSQAGNLESEADANFYSGTLENTPFIHSLFDATGIIHFEVTFKLDKVMLAEIIRDNYKKFEELYFKGHNNASVSFVVSGIIRQLTYNSSEMVLESALLNKRSFYEVSNGSPLYLNYIAENAGEDPILMQRLTIYRSVMNVFNDCVLLLDNDRYFVQEFESGEDNDLTPRTFKNWIFQSYLNPEKYEELNELISFIKDFKVAIDPRNSSLKNTESCSPLAELKIGFSKDQEKEINLMLEANDKRLPLSNFGTGIQQIFYILSKIFLSEAPIVLIEELELNLSPKYQSELLRHLKKLITDEKISQLLFTTHSKYFNYRSDFSIYEVAIDANTHTTVSKVPEASKRFFAYKRLDD